MSFSSYLNRYASIWTKFQLKPLVLNPNRDIYAITGSGLKNREMAGVDHLVVYMQTAAKHTLESPSGENFPGKIYVLQRLGPQRYTPPPGLGLKT